MAFQDERVDRQDDLPDCKEAGLEDELPFEREDGRPLDQGVGSQDLVALWEDGREEGTPQEREVPPLSVGDTTAQGATDSKEVPEEPAGDDQPSGVSATSPAPETVAVALEPLETADEAAGIASCTGG